MPEDFPADVERDPRFPSRAWTGFFLQYWLPGRHATNVSLTWRRGELTGEGRDLVGAYTVAGTYDLTTGRCEWTKQYIGKHKVMYRGVNDGRGIWGVWEIRQLGGWFTDRGGFHIWPEGTDVSAESDETERAVLEVMRKEFGGWQARALPVLITTLGAAGMLTYVWWRVWGF